MAMIGCRAEPGLIRELCCTLSNKRHLAYAASRKDNLRLGIKIAQATACSVASRAAFLDVFSQNLAALQVPPFFHQSPPQVSRFSEYLNDMGVSTKRNRPLSPKPPAKRMTENVQTNAFC
jgi:hypothetical protein